MSREIRVHNALDSSQVFTQQGLRIDPQQTRSSTSDDPVTLRLLERRRLIDVTPRELPNIEPVHIERPAGNASTEAWREYGIAQGLAPDDVAEAGREDIKAALEAPEDEPAEGDLSADPAHGDTVQPDPNHDESE